jgi:hypothetical protein
MNTKTKHAFQPGDRVRLVGDVFSPEHTAKRPHVPREGDLATVVPLREGVLARDVVVDVRLDRTGEMWGCMFTQLDEAR